MITDGQTTVTAFNNIDIPGQYIFHYVWSTTLNVIVVKDSLISTFYPG